MKRIFVFLLVIWSLQSVAQTSAKEYFNKSATLYVANKQAEALEVVNHGLEVYESDSSLTKLKRLIGNKNDQNQNKNDKNKDNKDENKDKNENKKNDSNSQKSENYKDKNGDKQNNSQENNSQNSQNKNSNSNKDNTKQEKSQPKSSISSNEAEMMLKAIENGDKGIQKKVQMQKQLKNKQRTIEKQW